MPKILGNRLGKNNKSCRIFHNESNKIEFAFFLISYDLLRILQDSAKGQTLFKNQCSQGSLRLSSIHRCVPGSRNPRKNRFLPMSPQGVEGGAVRRNPANPAVPLAKEGG
jgi:hypothetical protein